MNLIRQTRKIKVAGAKADRVQRLGQWSFPDFLLNGGLTHGDGETPGLAPDFLQQCFILQSLRTPVFDPKSACSWDPL